MRAQQVETISPASFSPGSKTRFAGDSRCAPDRTCRSAGTSCRARPVSVEAVEFGKVVPEPEPQPVARAARSPCEYEPPAAGRAVRRPSAHRAAAGRSAESNIWITGPPKDRLCSEGGVPHAAIPRFPWPAVRGRPPATIIAPDANRRNMRSPAAPTLCQLNTAEQRVPASPRTCAASRGNPAKRSAHGFAHRNDRP